MTLARQGCSDLTYSRKMFGSEESRLGSIATTTAGDSSDDDSLSGHSDDFVQKMPPPPQHYKKVIDTPVSANLPTDFAMAWNAAANVSGWKREEPDLHGKGKKWGAKKNAKKPSNKVAAGEPLRNPRMHAGLVNSNKNQQHFPMVECQDHRVEDMPLPRFLSLEGMTGPQATPERIELCDTTFYSSLTFANGFVHSGKEASEENVEKPLPGVCQKFLKIELPSTQDVQARRTLDFYNPCKKRVPTWSF